MKLNLRTLAAAPLFAAAAVAAAQTTGTAHPEALDDTISASQPATADHYVKPSAGTPLAAATATAPTTTTTTGVQCTQPAQATTADGASHPVLHEGHRPAFDPNDVNSGVVLGVQAAANELPEGTLLHVRLDQTLSTRTSNPGDHFTGRLTSAIERDGHVLVPAGSILRGRITEIRNSRPLLSDALMRLQPQSLTLPDGTNYPLNAELIDFDHTQDARIDTKIGPEGEVLSDPHTKRKVAGMTLTAASAGTAGAIIGGGVGFLIGATIGAGANVIMWSRQDHEQTLAAGTVMILDLNHSLVLNPVPASTIATAAGTE